MSKSIDRSFFHEDWENDETATQEYPAESSGVEHDQLTRSALEAYQKIKDGSRADPLLKELLGDVQRATARYLIVIADLNGLQSRQRGGDTVSRYEIQRADEARRSAHNALIDTINILSRAFAKKGLDNEWRKVIGLSAREEVTHWAIRVGSTVAADLEETKRGH